jgi:pilus assembly protein TadC
MKLQQAGMPETEEGFIKKILISAFYITTGLAVVIEIFLAKSNLKIYVLPIFPALFVLMFFYFLKMPDIKIIKKEKEINKEIVFAARFFTIELESGVPLYEALRHVADNYKVIGKYFKAILEDVDTGTNIEEAIEKAIELTPSKHFRRLLWQIINSLTTGAEISTAIKSVTEQIVREQQIQIQEYSRKLNPMAMFYMIMAVILPSIGVTMLVVLASFISLEISLPIFMVILGASGFMQLMFLSMIKSSRPPVEF